MSIWDSDYYYTRPIRQEKPAWYRLERYDYCEFSDENVLSAKRGSFARRAGKKRRR